MASIAETLAATWEVPAFLPAAGRLWGAEGSHRDKQAKQAEMQHAGELEKGYRDAEGIGL